ncbi:MAG TPA: LOG family protein [Nitrospiria bacterium]
MEKPKPSEANAGVRERLEAIFASPSYRIADRDGDFLNLDTTRGVRLQLDYLKAETLLARHDIRNTIVVFGGTRIPEPEEARKNAQNLQNALNRSPKNRGLQKKLAVAEKLLAKSRYYDVARGFGRLVGQSGEGAEDTRVVLMTGGGPGMMEAANRGAFDVGAKTIGMNIAVPQNQFPNPYITPELCFLFHYFAVRKLHFLLRAKALVAFPGGYGTLDELFETLTLIQTRTIQPLPVILVGRSFWERAFDVQYLLDEGVIDPEDAELFWYAETAEEIWEGILNWHQENGTPLFED